MAGPDVTSLISLAFGGIDSPGYLPFGNASNIVVGTNPPYTATQFLTFYPKFGGTPTGITGNLTQGSTAVASLSATVSLQSGQLVVGSGVTADSTIASVNSQATSLMLSQPAAATQSSSALAIITAPFVPLSVLYSYISLASASLQQAQWLEQWPMAMNLYVAHFATLYLLSDGSPVTSAGAAASAGFARGIQTSKAVGSVSTSSQPILLGESAGAWNLTLYGQQLYQMASLVNIGPVFIW